MLKVLLNRYLKYRNPVKYWRRLGVTIGNGCEIFSSASLGGEPWLVSIGDYCRINSNVCFITHDGGVWVLRHLNKEYKDVDKFGKISIGNNVQIGNNAIIMPNVKIGNNCIIGAGAVVTKDVPDNTIAAGVPARTIETIEEYIEKNRKNLLHTKQCDIETKKKIVLEHFKSNL